MNVIHEIIKRYNETRYTKEGEELFIKESKKLLDDYIDERIELRNKTNNN